MFITAWLACQTATPPLQVRAEAPRILEKRTERTEFGVTTVEVEVWTTPTESNVEVTESDGTKGLATRVYDAEGRILLERVTGLRGLVVESHRTYDARGNVLYEENGHVVSSFVERVDQTFDAHGNLTSKTWSKGQERNTRLYTHDLDVAGRPVRTTMTAAGRSSDTWMTYDARGNLIERRGKYATTTLRYDPNDLLVEERTVDDDGELQSAKAHRYNAFGERVETEVTICVVECRVSSTTTWTYDDYGSVLEEAVARPGSGGQRTRFTYTYES